MYNVIVHSVTNLICSMTRINLKKKQKRSLYHGVRGGWVSDEGEKDVFPKTNQASRL